MNFNNCMLSLLQSPSLNTDLHEMIGQYADSLLIAGIHIMLVFIWDNIFKNLEISALHISCPLIFFFLGNACKDDCPSVCVRVCMCVRVCACVCSPADSRFHRDLPEKCRNVSDRGWRWRGGGCGGVGRHDAGLT